MHIIFLAFLACGALEGAEYYNDTGLSPHKEAFVEHVIQDRQPIYIFND